MKVGREEGIRFLGMVVFLMCAMACASSSDNAGSGEPAAEENSESEDAISGPENAGEGGDSTEEEPIDEACSYGCNDGLSCTDDSCVDGKCVNELTNGTCLHEGVCYGEFELHPTDPCLVCEQSMWVGVPDGLVCNDDDPCTLDDGCVEGVHRSRNGLQR